MGDFDLRSLCCIVNMSDMPLAVFAHGRKGRGSFVLLAVLMAVGLMTLLVVAFLSQATLSQEVSFSSSGQMRAGIIAQTALDTVVGDLFDEIAETSNTNTPNLFIPTNGTFMPASSGNAGAINVVKISADGSTFWNGGGPARASAIPTTAPAVDGRYIGTNRWSLPALSPNLSVVPNWIYIERNGVVTNGTAVSLSALTNSTPANLNYAVGRFAYVIYDEGAGLDVNVAGHHTTMPANLGNELANRGNEGFVDLTSIGLTAAQVDALVTFRNPASGANGNLYLNYLLGLNTNSVLTNYSYIGVTNTTSMRYGDEAGFMTNYPGDQKFLGRMDFLRFAASNGITDINQLSALTTFTREKNAPIPAIPPGTINGAAAAAPNFTPNDSAYSSIPVYANATTLNTNGGLFLYPDQNLAVPANTPVLRRRFPLSWLAWIGPNGPTNGATAADVDLAFGLQWNSTDSIWTYDTADLDSTTWSIKDLTQVAAQNRSPNFFELLKAAISYKTLGQASGAAESSEGNTFPAMHEAFDLNTTLHLLQIGANILSEQSTANYPVRIRLLPQPTAHIPLLTGGSANTIMNVLVYTNEVYGAANLPYPSKIMSVVQRESGSSRPWSKQIITSSPGYVSYLQVNGQTVPASVGPNFAPPMPFLVNTDFDPSASDSRSSYTDPVVNYWTVFEVWNPNQTNANPNVPAGPTHFRIILPNSTDAYVAVNAAANYVKDDYKYTIAGAAASGAPGLYALTTNSFSAPITVTPPFPVQANTNSTYLATGILPWNPTTNIFTAPTSAVTAGATNISSEVTFTTNMWNPTLVTPQNDDPTYATGKDTDIANKFLAGILAATAFAPDYVDNPTKITAVSSGNATRVPPSTGTAVPIPLLPTSIADSADFPGGLGDPAFNDLLVARYSSMTLGNGSSDMSMITTFLVQYLNSGGKWVTYHQVKRPQLGTVEFNGGSPSALGSGKNAGASSANPFPDNAVNTFVRPDPRVDRFSGSLGYGNNFTNLDGIFPAMFPFGQSIWPPSTIAGVVSIAGASNPAVVPTNSPATSWSYASGWNSGNAPIGGVALNDPTQYMSYTDPDGTTRPADGYYANALLPYATTSGNFSRPVILNRPFRSVAELGYVNRDLPWRSLDFTSNTNMRANFTNADAALLDYFTASDSTVVAGRVSGATQNPLVWQGLLSGAALDPLNATNSSTNSISASMALNLAGVITNAISSTNSFMSKASIINSGLATTNSAWPAFSGMQTKIEREGPIRALEPVNTRTWNLMIDVIAQSGRIRSGATGLDQFVVEGERRYWLHIAIDRYTREVVDSYLEPISE